MWVTKALTALSVIVLILHVNENSRLIYPESTKKGNDYCSYYYWCEVQQGLSLVLVARNYCKTHNKHQQETSMNMFHSDKL